MTAPSLAIKSPTGAWGEDHVAAREVDDASRMVDAGGSSAVIPRLIRVIQQYPETKAAVEARFWLGRAYYEVGGHRDAIEEFNEYLKLAPTGRYAGQCATYVAQATEEYNAQFPTPEKLDAEIKAANDKLAAAPDDVQLQLQLADLVWKRGDYVGAGKLYKALVDKHPEYATNEALKGRVEFQPNNQYVVLSPAEIQRRQVLAQPLAIINQQSFRSGRDLFTRENRYYCVSGQVVNRGASPVQGVQVIITIFGFGNAVFDTNTVNIGRMNAGEIRAFSVRFSNFDNIENVDRVDCVATFQQ